MHKPTGPRVPKHIVIAFARLMGENAEDLGICHDIELGLKSGASPCCIAYYVKVWIRVCPPDAEEGSPEDEAWLGAEASTAWLNYFDWIARIRERHGAGIRCPACMLKQIEVEYPEIDTLAQIKAFYAKPDVARRIAAYNRAGEARRKEAIASGQAEDPFYRWDGQ